MRKRKYITLKALKAEGACDSGRNFFYREFGDGRCRPTPDVCTRYSEVIANTLGAYWLARHFLTENGRATFLRLSARNRTKLSMYGSYRLEHHNLYRAKLFGRLFCKENQL